MKLYVGNLNYDATESDMYDLFNPYGPVVDVFLPTDRETGRPRGFGFVTLETQEKAEQAIKELNGSDFQERSLVVNEAREKPRSNRTEQEGGFRRGGGGGGGRDRGRGRKGGQRY